VTLHPLAEQFGSVAEVYERGRPEYAPAVVGALAAELGLAPGARVLDLAAGTGKLTRALLAGGLDVVAVEPQGELRALLAGSVGPERALEGVAEAIPLPDDAVDAVTVADGFHWFDRAAALVEIRRVLRPRGGLVLLTMIPDWAGADWAHELGELMRELRPEHPHFDGPPWQQYLAEDGSWVRPREVRVTTTQPARPVLDYLASVSWVAAMSEEQRRETLARAAAALAEAPAAPEQMSVHVVLGLAELRD
jgi:ubiquinone/menaquinone biosynthesis C-methylase UbiE